MANQKCDWSLNCIQQWARAFQFIGAAILILLGFLRFFQSAVLADPPSFILSFYYFIFAFVLVACEFQWKFVITHFYFMYYSWGKGVIDFFLFTMCFDTEILPLVQIPVSIFFLCASVMYFIIAFACRNYKPEPAEKKEEEAKAESNQKAKAEEQRV